MIIDKICHAQMTTAEQVICDHLTALNLDRIADDTDDAPSPSDPYAGYTSKPWEIETVPYEYWNIWSGDTQIAIVLRSKADAILMTDAPKLLRERDAARAECERLHVENKRLREAMRGALKNFRINPNFVEAYLSAALAETAVPK
jgi:hypothetical protein